MYIKDEKFLYWSLLNSSYGKFGKLTNTDTKEVYKRYMELRRQSNNEK